VGVVRRPIALLVLLVLLAAGCGGGDDAPREDPSRASSTSTSEEPRRTTSANPAVPAAGDRDAGAAVERRDAPVRAAGGRARVEVVASGLEVPWDVTFLPDGRALVTERAGRVRLLGADGRLRRDPVATPAVQALGEGGLMGIDLDPRFADGRPFVYLMVTRAGQVRVLRHRWDERADRLRPDGTVLDGIVAGRIHDSGRLRFGPDRRLYVVTGDAGQAPLAQRRSSLNGKVLSLSPRQYRSRTDTPRIVSIGHRNPQGLDWQPGSGRLWVAEHGPSGDVTASCCDEVNLVRPGTNHAWPDAVGARQTGVARPERLWQRTIAPSGAAFVSRRGSAWTGDLLVAALRGTSLRRLDVAGTRVRGEEVLLAGRFGRLRAVVEAPDGALWVTTSNLDTYGTRTSAQDDRILRVVPPRS
jgi:glucose/arabinose dehydrogenase